MKAPAKEAGVLDRYVVRCEDVKRLGRSAIPSLKAATMFEKAASCRENALKRSLTSPSELSSCCSWTQ